MAKNKNSKSKEKEQLTPQELNQCLNYFEQFSKGYSYGYGALSRLTDINNLYLTPSVINAGIQNINMNPQVPTAEDITLALENPKTSEEILRNYAAYFEINNHLYKRLVNFDSELLAWNLTFDCYNAEDGDFDTEEFKKDLKVIDDFCSRFNLKDFKKIVYEILRQGVYYGVFRDEAEMYTWQELPADYCKITGDSNVGKLFDFDFSYFVSLAGTDINMFPKVFKKLYLRLIKSMGETYNPAGKVNTRHSSFVYWQEVSPRDNFFCFDLNNALNTIVPFYSSLFADMELQPVMRKLEKDKAMISAQKLLMGIIDTYDTAQSGTVPNQMRITPEVMGKFLSLARQALDKSIGITALPVKDAKAVDFTVEAQNRYTNYQRNLAANAVSSSASLLTENKLNQFESELALTIDENFVKGLYSQFEKFLNYYINRRTEKFKFNFTLSDTNTPRDKKMRKENFTDFAQMGIVDINLYARATDQNIFQALRAMKMTKSLGFADNLIELKSLNNQSSKKVGRPADEDSLNDSTEASASRGSNDMLE